MLTFEFDKGENIDYSAPQPNTPVGNKLIVTAINLRQGEKDQQYLFSAVDTFLDTFAPKFLAAIKGIIQSDSKKGSSADPRAALDTLGKEEKENEDKEKEKKKGKEKGGGKEEIEEHKGGEESGVFLRFVLAGSARHGTHVVGSDADILCVLDGLDVTSLEQSTIRRFGDCFYECGDYFRKNPVPWHFFLLSSLADASSSPRKAIFEVVAQQVSSNQGIAGEDRIDESWRKKNLYMSFDMIFALPSTEEDGVFSTVTLEGGGKLIRSENGLASRRIIEAIRKDPYELAYILTLKFLSTSLNNDIRAHHQGVKLPGSGLERLVIDYASEITDLSKMMFCEFLNKCLHHLLLKHIDEKQPLLPYSAMTYDALGSFHRNEELCDLLKAWINRICDISAEEMLKDLGSRKAFLVTPEIRVNAGGLFKRNEVDKVVTFVSNYQNHPKLAICAVKGMSGVGKTVCALQAAADRRVSEHYNNGVLRLSFGPDPDTRILRKWLCQFFGCEETDKVETASASQKGVIIADDLVSAGDFEAVFHDLAPTNCVIVTTRVELAVPNCPSAIISEIINVSLLSESESVRWFMHFAGIEAPYCNNADIREKVSKLAVEKCGSLPLAIHTVALSLWPRIGGAFWKTQNSIVQALDLELDKIEALEESEESRLHSINRYGWSESESMDLNRVFAPLHRALEVFFLGMDESRKRLVLELGALKPNIDVSLAECKFFWCVEEAAALALLKELDGASLITLDRPLCGHFRFHSLVSSVLLMMISEHPDLVKDPVLVPGDKHNDLDLGFRIWHHMNIRHASCVRLGLGKGFRTASLGNSLMYLAGQAGSLPAIEVLVNSCGISIDEARGTTRQTALHAAVLSGRANLVESLLSMGANPFATDAGGGNPVGYACGVKDRRISVSLLKHSLTDRKLNLCLEDRDLELLSSVIEDRDQDILDNMPRLMLIYTLDGKTAAHFAVNARAYRCLDAILKYPKPHQPGFRPIPVFLANIYRKLFLTDIFFSSRRQRLAETWDFLKSALFDPGDEGRFSTPGRKTLLMEASRVYDVNILERVFKEQSEMETLHKETCYGLDAIAFAVYAKQLENVKFLVQKGADPFRPGYLGQTALHLAALQNFVELADFLLQREDSIDMNPKMYNGRTPLMVASSKGHSEFVKRLLEEKGTEKNCRDAGGSTALHLAADQGHSKTVKLLLNCEETSADEVDSIGASPLHLAAKFGCPLCVDTILGSQPSRGINLNRADSNGRTALWLAASSGHLDVISLLLREPGINVTIEDTNGVTPKQVANHGGHKKIEKILEDFAPGLKEI